MKFMYVPNLPFNYAERTSKLNEVVNAIIDRREANTTALTAALRGAGGFGKSTLAIAVCADERIKQAFAGGIYWVDL